MDFLNHLWVYHSVHIIGWVGLCVVYEYNVQMKKRLAKQKALSYIKF